MIVLKTGSDKRKKVIPFYHFLFDFLRHRIHHCKYRSSLNDNIFYDECSCNVSFCHV